MSIWEKQKVKQEEVKDLANVELIQSFVVYGQALKILIERKYCDKI